MPRRLPVRPAKVFGNFFVLIVLSVMALIYYSFVFILYGPRAESKLFFKDFMIQQLTMNDVLLPPFFSYFERYIQIFYCFYRGPKNTSASHCL